MLKVLVAHAYVTVREGLALELSSRVGPCQVTTTGTETECLRLARTTTPDVVLVDSGIATDHAGLCADLAGLGLPVVMMTHGESKDYLALLEAGAQGVVPADDGLEGLVLALRTVVAGHTYVPAHVLGEVLRGLITHRRRQATDEDRLARLTPREKQVLRLLGTGADHRDIAGALAISPHTAKTHIHRLLTKLGVRSRAEAAALTAQDPITREEEPV